MPIDQSVTEIADEITLSLAEVERIDKLGEDYILRIENKGLTHRPDCFSHLGIAREVAAYFKTKLHNPLPKLLEKEFPVEKKLPLKIMVKAKKLCPRYCAVVLTDVKVTRSPNWLKTALERLGQKSINNVVDITNYVMFELGQPLHAFDYHKLKDATIIVRNSNKGEKLTTIDGKVRNLDEQMLVIADSEKVQALAGVQGGQTTQVDRKTQTIILEAANFDPINNRKTGKKLNLRTEASTRFEKNLDITLPLPAIKRTIELLQKLSSAKIASRIFDISDKNFKARKIKVSTEWINRFIGFNLTTKTMQSVLNFLGITTKVTGSLLTVSQPSWRPDINMEADIAEEVARIYGYDKIPITLPQIPHQLPKKNWQIFWRQKVKLYLQGLGFTEVHSQPFIGGELLKKTFLSSLPYLQLINPQTENQEFMRRSLIPSLLEVAVKNLNYFSRFRIYEINRIFLPRKKKTPKEITFLSAVTIGDNYVKVKGIMEALFEELGIEGYSFEVLQLSDNQLFNLNKSARVRINKSPIGVLGFIDKKITMSLGIDQQVICFDLNFEEMIKQAKKDRIYTPIPLYPPQIEDLTVALNKGQLIGPIIDLIKYSSKLVNKVSLIDELGRNFTLRIVYQHPQKTLSNDDVAKLREGIISQIEKTFAARIKGHTGSGL